MKVWVGMAVVDGWWVVDTQKCGSLIYCVAFVFVQNSP